LHYRSQCALFHANASIRLLLWLFSAQASKVFPSLPTHLDFSVVLSA